MSLVEEIAEKHGYGSHSERAADLGLCNHCEMTDALRELAERLIAHIEARAADLARGTDYIIRVQARALYEEAARLRALCGLTEKKA